jgi:hypothetical protein
VQFRDKQAVARIGRDRLECLALVRLFFARDGIASDRHRIVGDQAGDEIEVALARVADG